MQQQYVLFFNLKWLTILRNCNTDVTYAVTITDFYNSVSRKSTKQVHLVIRKSTDLSHHILRKSTNLLYPIYFNGVRHSNVMTLVMIGNNHQMLHLIFKC